MGTSNGYDWELIFKEYRSGVLSQRQVAKKHGVDPSYLSRQLKKHGVEKDLSSRVHEAVKTKLVSTSVHTPGYKKDDEDIVQEAADLVVAVVATHRKDIIKLREREAEILDLLANGTKPIWKRITITDDKGKDEHKVQIDHVPMTPIEMAITLNNLTTVQNRRVQLERQAYSLDDLASPIDDYHTVEIINPNNATFIEHDKEDVDG